MGQHDSVSLEARALRWPGERHYAVLVDRARKTMETWRRAWCEEGQAIRFDIACRSAHEVEQEQVQQWRSLADFADDEDGVWMSESPATGQIIAALLRLAPPSNGIRTLPPLAAKLVSEAIADCARVLRRAFVDDQGTFEAASAVALPAQHARPWAGAVRMDIVCDGDLLLLLHIGPRRVKTLVPVEPAKTASGVALSDPREALAALPTRLHVELSGVEITLGQIQSLALGDVLLLPHPLTQPLHVVATQGQSICAGYLGQQQGHKAIELVRGIPSAGM